MENQLPKWLLILDSAIKATSIKPSKKSSRLLRANMSDKRKNRNKKTDKTFLFYRSFLHLERMKGFEPSAHGLGSRYSTAELHPHFLLSPVLKDKNNYISYAFKASSLFLPFPSAHCPAGIFLTVSLISKRLNSTPPLPYRYFLNPCTTPSSYPTA